MYCLFPNLNEWMYVCLQSHRERSGQRARGTRRRSPWAAVGWWRQVSFDLSLSYSLFNSPPAYTFMPKDWLAFVIHVLVYLFGSDYYCLVWCYCSTLINEHDVVIYDTLFSRSYLWLYLWHLRGLERFLECLSVRTCSMDDRLGKQCNHEGGVGRP